MAFSRAVLVPIVLSFLLLNLLQSDQPGAVVNAQPGNPPIDCVAACQFRCSKSWKPKMCNKMCTGCCNKCACVPPGPTANRDVCPCYAQMKNPKKGTYKCP